MKVRIVILVILILLFSETKAQQYGWYYQNTFSNYSLVAIDFVDYYTGWLIGRSSFNYSSILKTSNSGNNWSIISSFNDDTVIYDVDFINSSTGWVCGDWLFEAVIFKSTDSGVSWFKQDIPPNNSTYLSSIKFINTNTGFAAGNLGLVLKTTNGGTNWILYSFMMADALNEIVFLNQTTGWLVGGFDTGVVYRTTNTGVNWSRHQFPFQVFSSVSFVDSVRGWATGSDGMEHGMISRTTNGGINWSFIYLPGTESGTSVKFVSHNKGWLVANALYPEAFIYSTTNGGDSWYIDFHPVSPIYLTRLLFLDSLNGWAIGSQGKILRYGDITSVVGSGEPQTYFELSQNYPNPFNPVTKIKFDIPALSLSSIGEGPGVRLIIYDVLAREVAVLVNQQLKPGTYEVEFDGSNLPSGVYFYKLYSGDFIETRKMVLLK